MKQLPSQLFQTNFIQRKQTYYNKAHYKRKANQTIAKPVAKRKAFQSKHYKATKANQTIWRRFKAKPMAKALAKLMTE